MEVLVTGATGFVGRHVAREFAAGGHVVRCLVRPTTDAGQLEQERFPVCRGHLHDHRSLDEAVRDAEVVVHVAGLITARSSTEMRRVNVEGAARLAAACSRSPRPPRRFLLVSSLAASGPSRGGRAVREDDPPRPVSVYGLTKLLGERAVGRALSSSIGLTVIRPPAVYGPFDRGIHPFFAAAARGLRLRIGSRSRRISLVHGADLARGVRLAAESSSAAGRTYFVADPASYAMNEVLDAIAAAVGTRTRTVRVPDAVLRAAGLLAEEAARWRGIVPLFSRDKVREFLAEGWVCDPTCATRELGWAPSRRLEEGLAETAHWYREHGWL